LNVGDVLTARITFSEAVNITGSPRLAIVVGSNSVFASYSSGTGSNQISFSYTIISGQTDSDGIAISLNSVSLNGGTIIDLAGNSATITHAAVAANSSFKVDTTSPAAPVLALGSGVSTGASAAEAVQASGVITVNGESGASIVVTFSRSGGGSLTKTVTGTGSPVAVTLVSADLPTLGDGLISVSATSTDLAGNSSTAGTSSFTLDTSVSTPVLSLGTGIGNGATATEAVQATGVTTVTAETGSTVVVTFSRSGGGSVPITVTAGATATAVVLSAANLTNLGNGLIQVSAVATDTAAPEDEPPVMRATSGSAGLAGEP
jgi:hypothetical protein